MERHDEGILAYSKDGSKYKRRKDSEIDNKEALWTELQNYSRKKVVLSFFINHPTPVLIG